MMRIGTKISIGIGSNLGGSPQLLGLKNSVYDDYINSGELITSASSIDIWGRFNDLTGEKIMGCIGGSARFYFGIYLSQWRFAYGNYNTVALGGLADTDYHKFSIRNGIFYVDNVSKIDLSSASFTDADATNFWFYRINLGTDYSTRFTMTKTIINDTIEFLPHKDGYWLKDGTPIYNRGEATNLYPLEAIYL